MPLINVVNYRRLQSGHHAHQAGFETRALETRSRPTSLSIETPQFVRKGYATEQRCFLSPKVRKGDRKWSYELLPINRRHCVADKQHNIPAWVATIMGPRPPISVMIAFVELVMQTVLSYRLTCLTLSLFSPGMKFYPTTWCTGGSGRRNCKWTPPGVARRSALPNLWFLSGGG